MGLRVCWLDAPGYIGIPSFTMQIERRFDILLDESGRMCPRTGPSRLLSFIFLFKYPSGPQSYSLFHRCSFFLISPFVSWAGLSTFVSFDAWVYSCGLQLDRFWKWLLHITAPRPPPSTGHLGMGDLGRTWARRASPNFEMDDRSHRAAFGLAGWLRLGKVC